MRGVAFTRDRKNTGLRNASKRYRLKHPRTEYVSDVTPGDKSATIAELKSKGVEIYDRGKRN